MDKKILKNTTISDINLKSAGIRVPALGQTEIDRGYYNLLSTVDVIAEIQPYLASGAIVINDGINDLTAFYGEKHLLLPEFAFNQRFLSDPERINGFLSKTSQEAIEEARQSAFSNDLDTLQFARQGSTSSNTDLLTLNNLSSYESPNTLAYNIFFRKLSFSVSNITEQFTVNVYKASPDHSIRTLIYSETFSIANGNSTGHSGYTLIEQNIHINKGFGIYIIVTNVGNPKPSDLSVLFWYRQG